MITEDRLRELYNENRKAIMKAIRKLPAGYHLEVAFYSGGRVWISDPIQQYAWMDWHPDFSIQYTADRFMTYAAQDELFEARLAYVELEAKDE